MKRAGPLSMLAACEDFKQLELRPLSYERETVEIESFLKDSECNI